MQAMAMELTLARFIEERGVTAGFPYVKKKKCDIKFTSKCV